MRCLYCGNELALLKKLTGYGEFCSEAHRQKYQEQYNRLALTRLLQAQDTEPERRPPLSRTPVRPSSTLGAGKPIRELDGASPAIESPPAPPPPAPAAPPLGLGGFISQSFEPALSPAELFSANPFLAPVTSCLPDSEAGGAALDHAPLPAAAPGAMDPPPLAQPAPVDLPLVRVTGSFSGGEGAIPFELPAKYEATLGDLACLPPPDRLRAEAVQPEMSSPSARDSHRAENNNGLVHGRFEDSPTHAPPEPDAALFERAVTPEAARQSGRPPVVINFAALGLLGLEFEAEPDQAAPPETGQAPEDERPHQAASFIEAPAASEAPAPTVEVPASTKEPEPVEVPIQKPVIPALCTQAASIGLQLEDGAFLPIDGAQFEPALFAVQTPTVATCPLRPKVVFGPSPIQTAGETGPEIADPGTQYSAVSPPEDAAPVGIAGNGDSATGIPLTPADAAGTGAPEVEVLGPQENPRLKNRRRIAELTRKLGQPSSPEPEAPEPPQTPAPEGGVAAVEPPVSIPALSEPAAARGDRSRREPAVLDALRLEMERKADPTYGAPPKSRRIAVVVALLIAILLLGYLLREALAAKTDAAGTSRAEVYGPALIGGEGGWSLEWNGGDSGRQVEIFRPSLTMSDYRFEFQGQIDTKALGWIFRAVNPRNFYAMKIELIDTGSSSATVLSRAAIIDGEETQRVQVPLKVKVLPGAVFKVRSDVLGSTFRTYVQDELADTWIDDRLKIGGIGLLKDRDESADVRLIQLHGLRAAN